MKKERKQQLAFHAIRENFTSISQGAARSGTRNLTHHETVIRTQLRKLSALPPQVSQQYSTVLNRYVALLDDVSRRILERYNQKHRTDYSFDQVVENRRESYLQSGILSVLLSTHIPQMVAAEFDRLLPQQPSQEYPEARLLHRRFLLHLGDTNTGKTYRAIQRLKQGNKGIYLAPLRILALENFERLNNEGVACSLLTGEEELSVPNARHLCCTVEKAPLGQEYDVAVIDEVQLLGDLQRGDAWTRAILGLRCTEIHLCGAALAQEQLVRMITACGDEYQIIPYQRLVPLQMLSAPLPLSRPEPGDAFVAFSKRKVLNLASQFRQRGVSVSVIYGDLPPEVRRAQYETFVSGVHTVLVATDAIGMGVNLPIRRIIFTEIEKFDGESIRPLTSQEVKQIAGRAGRIGIFEVGYVGALDRDGLELLAHRLDSDDPPLTQAVIGPSQAMLQIDLLPLQQKLALWSTRPEHSSHYCKKDVRNELMILELLKPYHLPEPVQWRLMQLPFDVENEVLLEQFQTYVQTHFLNEEKQLPLPLPPGPSCSDWEVYYRQIGLYYSFCKAMGLPLDEQWVSDTRAQVSHQIQSLLERAETGRSW